jgi:ribosome biogenesis protein ENP2
MSGINSVIINPAHQLFGLGSEDSTVEFWDPRSRSRVGVLVVQSPSLTGGGNNTTVSITAMEYGNDGLSLAVGTSTGHVLLYDLRTSRPRLVKDHQYGFPIKCLRWYDDVTGDKGRRKVISADCKIVKIWNHENVRVA